MSATCRSARIRVPKKMTPRLRRRCCSAVVGFRNFFRNGRSTQCCAGMEAMERRNGLKTMLDDTETLSATIERTTSVQGHTEYIVKVQRGPLSDNSWFVRRRYNDFALLHGVLQASNIDLLLPPKKIFGNMDREFVSVRQQGLQNYLNTVLSYPILSSSLPVKRFLDPTNYLQNFQEKTLQHVFMSFRSEPTWNVIESIPDIGWRIRRHYFLARKHNDPKQDYVMSWCEYGPDVCLQEREMNAIMKLLTNLNHPFICPATMASSDKTGGIAIYPFLADGSLKDRIFMAKPKTPYFKKYRRTKASAGLPHSEVKGYGRQILEALKFLHNKGFPYGHLHSGNVLIEDGVCRLVGLENVFFGLSSYYRSFASNLLKVKTLQDMDLYALGHIIYEMAFGESLNSPTCDSYPPGCPPEIKCVLESLLSTEACKGGLPSAEDLLTHPFFSNINLLQAGKPHFKLNSQLRESIREVQTRVDLRLLQDQKMIRQIQRLLKAQAILSEENHLSKKNTLVSKKIKKNSQETRSVSPSGSTENGSSSAPTPPALSQPAAALQQNHATPPPPPPPPLPPGNSAASPNSSGYGSICSPSDSSLDRSQLLGSIQNFNKTMLRKATTSDRSDPLV